VVEPRVPVFERRIDNIVGIAYAMDMLDYVEQVKHSTVQLVSSLFGGVLSLADASTCI